ncbi:MAG: hypothetical protein FWE61_07715, partial [Micrococcales bacterium]|nr:hypothetical protein [Micrococcales bacterium]
PQVLSMMVYSGYAMAYAPLEPGSTKFDEYTWRDGKVTHKPAPSQPKPADVPKMLFDLTTVDWSVVESLVATVAARVPEESVTYVWAHRPGTLFTTYSTVFTHGITTTTMFSVATSGDYNSSGFHADARGKLVD